MKNVLNFPNQIFIQFDDEYDTSKYINVIFITKTFVEQEFLQPHVTCLDFDSTAGAVLKETWSGIINLVGYVHLHKSSLEIISSVNFLC